MSNGQNGQQQGYYMPDQAVIDAGYKRAQELNQRGGDGPKKRFFNPPGPDGSDSWKQAYKGFSSTRGFFAAPPWREGTNNFAEIGKYFYKSTERPQGTSVHAYGPTFIDDAYHLALDAGQKSMYGRRQHVFMYQGFAYHFDQQQRTLVPETQLHVDEADGLVKPFIWEAKITAHNQVQEIVATNGWGSIFNPQAGRPLLVTKKKTGGNPTDVEWHVGVFLEPIALDPLFWPALQGHLHELDKLYTDPTKDQQMAVIQAMGLPMPPKLVANATHHQQGAPLQGAPVPPSASYQQQPAPPYPNPHQAAQQPPVQQHQPQQYAPPPQQQYQQQPPPAPPQQQPPPAPPQQYQQQPQQYQQQPQQYQQQQPKPLPAPQHQQQQAVQQPVYAPQPGAQHQQPPAPPPPMQRQPVPPAQQPPPVQQPSPAVPPQPPSGAAQGAAPPTPQQLTLPLAPGIELEGGRQMCFGKHNEGDAYCQKCPSAIKDQCVPLSPGGGNNLDQVEAKLTEGGPF